ncbi:MAG: helix-turn-helix transcriptional regulator [Gemmatimonadetes bacterium]|nr:helix-turn-helix transcriptional regulator [Gemmatimonadota bacterium]MYA11958.1 helix-turn-helix transcriptional regulator [Gemmatimonadota bacterium]MYD13268.1 helix-turn-helix transcriptional regulator [Gemmatimonadota bacterium]MYE71257.1 helix-turn-helix transcriptional regulator [Gemmatimonadota bacterium]MYJ69870.1 helix-turn-helix transcriptional regulator [Gemmatimonadota bacterium]
MTVAEIGNIVRSVRRAQHLRQDELAGVAGVGVRFLSELERGKTTVRLDKVLAVLEALGCTLHIEAPQIDRGGVTRVVATEPPWMRRRRLQGREWGRAGGQSRL